MKSKANLAGEKMRFFFVKVSVSVRVGNGVEWEGGGTLRGCERGNADLELLEC